MTHDPKDGAESTEIARLRSQVQTLEDINRGLVRDHNALLIDGSRWQTRAEAAEADHAALVTRLQEQVHKWQPIATAPKDGTTIIGALIGVDGSVFRVHDMKHNGLAFYTTNGGSLPPMTHWMSMPDLAAVRPEGRSAGSETC